jgi:hypothetical protein
MYSVRNSSHPKLFDFVWKFNAVLCLELYITKCMNKLLIVSIFAYLQYDISNMTNKGGLHVTSLSPWPMLDVLSKDFSSLQRGLQCKFYPTLV